MENKNISYPVVSFDGKDAGSIELPADIYAQPLLQGALYDTVRWQLMKRRQGTHKVLTKGEMKGGGKKPWKQKGTGRARAGSNTSPVWVGGAVAHGPKPRDYTNRTNKNVRAQALKSALSDMVKERKLIIVDAVPESVSKTKDFVAGLKAIGVHQKKLLFVQPKAIDAKVDQASRNVARLSTSNVGGLNVYDILNNDVILLTKAGLADIAARFESNK